jgi:hypothetical protein
MLVMRRVRNNKFLDRFGGKILEKNFPAVILSRSFMTALKIKILLQKFPEGS